MAPTTSTLSVLRVFVDAYGRHGNGLGVFLDGPAVAPDRRQAVAAELGFAETVFVEDRADGVVRIFTPTVQLDLAGHPLVGTSWLLTHEGSAVPALRPPAGIVETWSEGELVYIRADPAWCPQFELVELPSVEDVERHPGPPEPHALLNIWAWSDRDAGRVRARVFAAGVGVPEDEATGSAALRFAAELDREVTIEQGRGSIIMARPGPNGMTEVGGRCALDATREFTLA